MAITLLDTKNINKYSDLYINLKRINGNIKDHANKNDDISASAIANDNSKNFFDKIYRSLLDITEVSDIAAVYPETSELIISDTSGNTNSLMDEENFKRTLENCFNLKIYQTYYTSSGTASGSVGNTKLDALTTGSTKQHLLYYNKISSDTQYFDEKRVKQIYYTIFLLDVYINIVEAFLSINLNEDKDKNRNMWDNNITKTLTDESEYKTKYPENETIIPYSSLKGVEAKKTIKDYKDIHIVCKPLYSNSQRGMFINTEISGLAHKQGKDGLYLYIGNKFVKQQTNNYFQEVSTEARSDTRPPNDDSLKLSSKADKDHTFNDRYGTLFDGILLSKTDPTKYTYGILEYSFDNETSGDYTDTKRPYQKLIRMFLIMIRNIKYDNLSITLEYLKFYLHSLKTLLLMSINAINIYHNLAWSLKNCLVLNYPDYKKDKFIKYIISDTINLNEPSLSLEKDYSGLTNAHYTDNNNFVYHIKNKNVTATSTEHFRTALDYNINNIENEINKIKEVLPIKNRYNYAAEPTELIFSTFSYDRTNNKISGTTTMSNTKAKLINDQSNTKKNYLLYIPDYDIKSRIKDISLSATGEPEIIINDDYTDLINKGTADATNNKYTHNQKSVYLFAIGISELEDKNLNLSNNINNFENNINHNKTKILNNKSIFETNKSKNRILYYELLIFTLIIIFIIFTLIVINIAKIEIGLMKMISLICFGTLIVLFSLYYIINTLYIDESYIETFTNTGTQPTKKYTYTDTLCPAKCVIPIKTTTTTDEKLENDIAYKTDKKTYVINMLNNNCTDLINLIKLSYTYSDTQTLFNKEIELNSLIMHKYNDKSYVNSFLENKTSDANINTDMIKYENANYNVTLFSIILLGIIIISFYNINLFTNNKYMGLLFLTAIILIIILFTYYLININKIVRTISSNYYWGKEFEKTYESFENRSDIY